MGRRLPYTINLGALTSPDTSALGRQETGALAIQSQVGSAGEGRRGDWAGAGIDPRIVTMFWDGARYSVLDGRSSVGLLYGTKFGVRV